MKFYINFLEISLIAVGLTVTSFCKNWLDIKVGSESIQVLCAGEKDQEKLYYENNQGWNLFEINSIILGFTVSSIKDNGKRVILESTSKINIIIDDFFGNKYKFESGYLELFYVQDFGVYYYWSPKKDNTNYIPKTKKINLNKNYSKFLEDNKLKLNFFTSEKNPIKSLDKIKSTEIACWGGEMKNIIVKLFASNNITINSDSIRIISTRESIFKIDNPPKLFITWIFYDEDDIDGLKLIIKK